MGMAASPTYRRPHHQRIAKLLQAFDPDLLLKAECYFGGGTAVALLLDEYRESVDIDFLCSSQDGYRMLRSVVATDLGPLLRYPVKHLREVTSTQNKILTFLEIDGVRVKVELLREGNTSLEGHMSTDLGVPILSRTDLWAQKLMANADRALDKSTLSRDIIDLAMMIRGWGPIPRDAFDKAHAAYGDSLARGFHNAVGMVADPVYFAAALQRMGMDPVPAGEIVPLLDDAAAALPLTPDEQAEHDRRVAAMPQLEHCAGAPFILWRTACAALVEGAAEVNWAQVERDAVREGIALHGRGAHDMIDTIARFSPTATSTARIRSVSTRIEREAPALEAEYAAHRTQAEHAGPQ